MKRTYVRKNNRLAGVLLMPGFFALMIWLMAVTVMAAPKVREIEYKGNGRVEVEFAGKVRYKNVKVTVKDTAGKQYAAKIVERDDDDLDFTIKGFKNGATYRFTISGIRKVSEKNYGKVNGQIKLPKIVNGIVVREVDYDAEDREVSFDFAQAVQWKNPTVTISDGKTNYVRRITEKNAKEIEVLVKKLTRGKTYTYKITGIRRKGTSKYVTVTGKFKA